MDCRTISTKKSTAAAAFTFIELTVAMGLGFLVFAAVLSFSAFSNRSFAYLANYADLDQRTELALDKMSREIRQVHKLTGFAANKLTFEDYDGNSLKYIYDAGAQTLTRVKQGSGSETLLTNCDYLQFSIFQRTPSNGTFQPFTTALATNTKVIELTWNCYRTVLGSKANTESMQSAKVVIRDK
jgi:hypothetical protein